MDNDILKLLAHVDQTRSEVGAIVKAMSGDEAAWLIRHCAEGDLSGLDERQRLLVGMLAVVTIFDLFEAAEQEGRP